MLTLLAFRRRRGRRNQRDSGQLVFGTIGWLFADLMTAIAMAFLVATTVGQPPRPVAVSASESATPSPSPSPSREPALELEPVVLSIKVDWSGLLGNRPAARKALADAVRKDPRLRGRHAGLVLTYGGAKYDEGQAIAIANKANGVLRSLGSDGYVFRGTVYHKPFLSLYKGPEVLDLDIYLFKE